MMALRNSLSATSLFWGLFFYNPRLRRKIACRNGDVPHLVLCHSLIEYPAELGNLVVAKLYAMTLHRCFPPVHHSITQQHTLKAPGPPVDGPSPACVGSAR